MLNESLLWSRTFSPVGRPVKEPTALGAALLIVAGSAAVAVLFFAAGYAIALFR